jgi:hypothetical protein
VTVIGGIRRGLHAAAINSTLHRQARARIVCLEFGIHFPSTNGTENNARRGAMVVTHLTA